MENEQEKSLFDDLVAFDEPTPILDEEQDINESVDDVVDNDTELVEDEVGEEVVSEEAIEEDNRVEALYELLIENQIVAKNDDFKPTLDNLQELVESLPEQYFLKAAESLPSEAKQIAQAIFYLGENATRDEIIKLLDNPIPTVDFNNEDASYNYLYDKLKGTKGFKDDAKLKKYLDTLKEDESINDTAKELYDEDIAEQEQAKQSQLDNLKQQKVEREQQVKQFYKNIDAELKNLPWQQDKKQQVVEYLQPDKVDEINKMIQSSPMAIIQLADIYTRFNPDTKQFDLSDFELKTESKKNSEMKDNAKKAKLDSILSKVKSGKNNVASSQQQGFFSQFEKTN